MTERKQFDLDELKREMLWGPCTVCGKKPAVQLAHRIPQTKGNLEKYGKAVIHHRLNLMPVCGLACNAAVNIEHKPQEKAELLKRLGYKEESDENTDKQ